MRRLAGMLVVLGFLLGGGEVAAAAPPTLSAGTYHSCWVAPDTARAYCWGQDGSGQLGNGPIATEQLFPSPVDASGLPAGAATRWSSLAVGDSHSCGITTAGLAACWGSDNGGRLGVGPDFDEAPVPRLIDVSALPVGTTWREIATGASDHACAITTAGAAYCWGGDWMGKLGNGAPEGDFHSPTAVDLPNVTWSVITTGREHTCGLTTDGAAYCWGGDGSGQLGNGAITAEQATPSPVDVSGLPAGTRWASISAGYLHTCAVTTAGAAYCWGGDSNGQLGNGAGAADQASPSPVEVPAGTRWATVDVGDWHSCAATDAGVASCWGDAASGRLGNGVTTGSQTTPAAVDMATLPAGTAWAALTAGGAHTCALTTAAKAYCFGESNDGRLGIGPVSADPSRPATETVIRLALLADRVAVTGAIGDPTNPGLDLVLVAPSGEPGDVQVSAQSSNEAVLPSANITVHGTGARRVARFEPVAAGTATVTFTTAAGGSLTIGYAASTRAPDPSGRYHGWISDASAGVDVGGGYMLLANDETNVLFLHKQGESGPPVKIFDLTHESQLNSGEIDIESGARTGDTIVWLASHGNSRSGGNENRRRVTFATRITESGADTELTFAGRYGGGPGNQTTIGGRGMRGDLIAWDQNNGHGLGADALRFAAGSASGVLPNAPDGFNVEGFEFAPDRATGWLGFRAPTVGPNYDALIVPVTNLLALVDGIPAQQTGLAQFGAPIFLDLNGRSIRELRRNAANEYLIVAGASPQNPSYALFTWDGNPASKPQFNQLLPDENYVTGGAWEALGTIPASFAQGGEVRVVADSGDTIFYGNQVNNDLEQPFMKAYSQAFQLKPVRAGEDRSGFAVVPSGKQRAKVPFSLRVTGAKGFDGAPIDGAVRVDVGTTNLGSEEFSGTVTFTDGAATVPGIALDLVTRHQLVVRVDGVGEPVRLDVTVVADSAGPPIEPVDAKRMAMGTQHACALFNGRAYCWGSAANGRLGTGPSATGNVATPTPVDMSTLPDGARFVSLAAGNDSSCGLTADGAVYCWGRDFLAKLGNGTALTADQFSPSFVDTSGLPAGTQFVSLTMGRDQVCALTKERAAYCWGYGQEGGVGNPDAQTEVPAPLPVDMTNVPAGVKFAHVDAGSGTTCALTTAGAPYCWGNNSWGQIGDGTTTQRRIPVAVDLSALPAGTAFASIAPGRDHSCGVTVAGKAYCWGADGGGQLGNGTATAPRTLTPVAVDAPEGVVFAALAAGDDTSSNHTCGLTSSGSVYCWGTNTEGANGFPTTGITHAPRLVVAPAGVVFTEISVGRRNTCAYTAGKRAYCWGSDTNGQLGNGPVPAGQQSAPSEVLSPTPIQDAIADLDDLHPDVAPVSEVVESGKTLTLGDGLVSATFADPAGGSGRVLLARYADGFRPASNARGLGMVYDVHFEPTPSTGPNATLTVELTGLGPDVPLRYFDGDSWEPIVSSGAVARSDAAGRATVVFGPASTPTLRGLGGTPIATVMFVDEDEGSVGGSVPATLALTLGAPATFGTFQPGVAREYTATTSATVISTAGDAALSVADPSTSHTGHLVNGSFALPQPLQGLGMVKTWAGPTANESVPITFTQSIGAGDALRTGAYSKTLTLTLSTTTP